MMYSFQLKNKHDTSKPPCHVLSSLAHQLGEGLVISIITFAVSVEINLLNK